MSPACISPLFDEKITLRSDVSETQTIFFRPRVCLSQRKRRCVYLRGGKIERVSKHSFPSKQAMNLFFTPDRQ